MIKNIKRIVLDRTSGNLRKRIDRNLSQYRDWPIFHKTFLMTKTKLYKMVMGCYLFW